MIPVILVHSGNPHYLTLSIRKALEKNTVFLIGDSNPGITDENFKFFNISDYINDDYNRFSEIYEHLSTNPYEFELFCFLRWFLIDEIMRRENIDVSFYIDSDVMLYADVNQEYEKFDQYEMTLLHRTACISSFLTKRGISDFCKMLIGVYSDKNTYSYQKIKSHFVVRKNFNLGGGVCDMTLFDFFHYNADLGGGPGRVGEMMHIIDDSTYDHNINVPDQDFDFANGIKNVKMIDGIPYVYSHKMKKMIRFNSLHFNSGAKFLMEKYS